MSDQNKDWWRGAVMYQIYPRSFMDSNGDGIGDLPGITDRLDYVAALGVEGVWISPFFQSPMADFGYDVSDYCAVDPIFGANEDFDMLLRKAHDLGLKIIVDLVLSHTSDKHAWFGESRRDRENAKSDWYVWADPKQDGAPPNNWQSCFGGSAWTFDTHRGQYYLHNFLKEQPDLNFHNPDVQKAILDTARYWLERGVDGFRMDVVNFYFHDQSLRDNPPRRYDNESTSFAMQFEKLEPYNMQAHIYDKSQPENLVFLEKFRELTEEFDAAFTVGEIGDDHPYERSAEYTTGKRLNTTYNTHMMSGHQGKELTTALIRAPIETFLTYPGDGWPSWAFCNHDVVRSVTRWGRISGYENDPCFAKMLTALLCSLRGTLFMYQGEELGLPEADIPFEKIQDPWGKYLWPEWQGRDGCRTPMPWRSEEHNAGFTRAEEAWLPVPDSHRVRAVDIQEIDPHSPLNFTRAFLKWRKQQDVLRYGRIQFVESGDEKLLAFTREGDKDAILCLFNLSDVEKRFAAPSPHTMTGPGVETDQSGRTTEKGDILLPPFGFYFASMA
jgi:alpha-glucosidase